MDKTPTQWMVEPLRKYAQFTGRSRRAEYWWFVLFGLVVAIIAAIVDSVLGLRSARGGTGPIGGLISLVLLVPQLAVGFRRMHDIGRSGWWTVGLLLVAVLLGVVAAISLVSGAPSGGGLAVAGLLGLVIFVYSIVLIVWFCQRGTVGDNRFGPDPLAETDLL